MQRLLVLFFTSAMFFTIGRAADFRLFTVYGDDGRLDLFEVHDTALLELADSTLAVVERKKLVEISEGSVLLATSEYGRAYGLCAGEHYYDQPIGAYCTAFLVAEDLVVTAGHCVRDIKNSALVFGFAMRDPEQVLKVFNPSEIYYPQTVVVSVFEAKLDYAVIRLDRKVVGHRPLHLRTQGTVQPNTELFLIGYPTGLPLKIALGGQIRKIFPYEQFFVTNLDAFGSNSGSPVFNAETLDVEGILVRGGLDFRWNYVQDCMETFHCQANDCRGEDVTMIATVLSYVY